MIDEIIIKAEKILNLFPEVTWDRYAGDYDNFVIYGWIDRDDQYKDFLVMEFEEGQATSFTTSSAKYSKDFSERLGWQEFHSDCKRVENIFQNVKSIKINNEK